MMILRVQKSIFSKKSGRRRFRQSKRMKEKGANLCFVLLPWTAEKETRLRRVW